MFISEPLVFVELHKTAGSHIGRCLDAILNGRQEGKHNAVPRELHQRFILGSIRNPWDWYVSLWGFGCDGNGSVNHQTTRRFNFSYYWRQLNKEMGRSWLTPTQYIRQITADARKPVEDWRAVYADSNDPQCFRAWLKMIFDPNRRFDMGEGYGFSPISAHSGLLTYRYFKLFTSLGDDLYRCADLLSSTGLNDSWHAKAITNFIVRNEALEEDLIEGLKLAGVELSQDQRALILSGKDQKTNTSTRKAADFYYDEESIALIEQKESFIIRQYNYQPPFRR